MNEHVKYFATGLAISALATLAIIGVVTFWKPVLFTALTVVGLFAIYMIGHSYHRKDARND